MLVSPASAPVGEDVNKTCLGMRTLKDWGLQVAYHPPPRSGFLACSDADRLPWVQTAFDDAGCSAVICVRGGYGTQRIIDALDFKAVIGRRAAFVGFSDVTPLHTLLNAQGLVTFYGPPVLRLSTSKHSADHLHAALFGTDSVVLSGAGQTITDGSVLEARVLGGNLTMLASSAGTSSAFDGSDAIVFLEETKEQPRVIDRLLTQLLRSGAFVGVRGFVLGQFTGCAGPADEPNAQEVIAERLADLGVPIVGGFPVGHGDDQETLPLGAMGILDPMRGELRFRRV